MLGLARTLRATSVAFVTWVAAFVLSGFSVFFLGRCPRWTMLTTGSRTVEQKDIRCASIFQSVPFLLNVYILFYVIFKVSNLTGRLSILHIRENFCLM